MKKFLIVLTLSVFSLSACSKVEETYDAAVKKGQEAADKVIEIKDKTVETVNDIEKAVDKVAEATDAVKEISK